jgi:hypothetical protein
VLLGGLGVAVKHLNPGLPLNCRQCPLSS